MKRMTMNMERPRTRYAKSGDINIACSGLTFTERGSHRLKGIPGEWTLYAVA